MNKLRKLSALLLTGVLMLSTSVFAFADEGSTASAPTSQVFDLANISLVNQDEADVQKVLNEIYNKTGIVVDSVYGDEIFIKSEPQLAFENIQRGTSIPTSRVPSDSFTSDWSGTVNYTYTLYYTNLEIRVRSATTHTCDYYTSSGTYIGYVVATYQTFAGVTDYMTGLLTSADVYAKIINTASGSSLKATYTLTRSNW